MTKTERKVRRCYIELMGKIAKSVPLDKPLTKEMFDQMWQENWYYVMSSKYSELVHNSASALVSDNFLRPIGIRYGYLKAEE